MDQHNVEIKYCSQLNFVQFQTKHFFMCFSHLSTNWKKMECQNYWNVRIINWNGVKGYKVAFVVTSYIVDNDVNNHLKKKNNIVCMYIRCIYVYGERDMHFIWWNFERNAWNIRFTWFFLFHHNRVYARRAEKLILQ